MNPQTVAEAVALAKASDVPGLVVCPPFPFLEAVGTVLKKAELGAQDLPPERHTLVRYAILGHSSRRKLGETDEMVAQKVAAAVRQGIAPIVCIGETRVEHDAGKSKEVVKRQLIVGLGHVTRGMGQGTADSLSHVSDPMSLVIAYEPVWAISTEPGAKADTPESAVAMIRFMKKVLGQETGDKRQGGNISMSHVTGPMSLRFIYGGSVTPANAESFLKQKDIEGALVGGASLQPDEMRKILEVASQY